MFLDYTLGDLEVGVLISSFLYGVTSVQVLSFYLFHFNTREIYIASKVYIY